MGDLLPCQLVSELNPGFLKQKKTYLQVYFFFWVEGSRLMNKSREAYPSIAENHAANHQFTIYLVNDTIWKNCQFFWCFCVNWRIAKFSPDFLWAKKHISIQQKHKHSGLQSFMTWIPWEGLNPLGDSQAIDGLPRCAGRCLKGMGRKMGKKWDVGKICSNQFPEWKK